MPKLQHRLRLIRLCFVQIRNSPRALPATAERSPGLFLPRSPHFSIFRKTDCDKPVLIHLRFPYSICHIQALLSIDLLCGSLLARRLTCHMPSIFDEETEAATIGVVFIIGFRNSERAFTGYVSALSELVLLVAIIPEPRGHRFAP